MAFAFVLAGADCGLRLRSAYDGPDGACCPVRRVSVVFKNNGTNKIWDGVSNPVPLKVA